MSYIAASYQNLKKRVFVHLIVTIVRRHRSILWPAPSHQADVRSWTKNSTLAFGVNIDKDVVRRILGKHYRPESGSETGA
jgi:hypothetical protein